MLGNCLRVLKMRFATTYRMSQGTVRPVQELKSKETRMRGATIACYKSNVVIVRGIGLGFCFQSLLLFVVVS
jgi:hypothetical protein